MPAPAQAKSLALPPEAGRRVPNGEDLSPIAKSQALFKQFDALDEALSWARHVDQTGRVALLIEGDDGTRLDRREIGAAIKVGERERLG